MCIHTKQSCIHTTVYVPVRVNTQCQSINFGKLKYFWETKRGVCPPCMYHTNIRARKYPISTTKLEKKVEVRLNLTQKANNENPVRTSQLVSLKAPRLPEEWLRYCRCCCSWWSSSFLLSWKSVCVFFTWNRVLSTRRHPAHPVSSLSLQAREIQALVTSSDHRNYDTGNYKVDSSSAMPCHCGRLWQAPRTYASFPGILKKRKRQTNTK